MIAKPRLAATIILLRAGAGQDPFEVFLTRRPETMAFLGGMFCFPGGTLRKQDYSPAALKRATGLNAGQARKTLGADLPPSLALGLMITAVRELFEETGVLLARDDSSTVTTMGANANERLLEKHSRLLSGALTFPSLLESEGLFCDSGALARFSHWQTPEQIALRFDTHFFLAELPAGQTPLPITPEVAASLWLSPDAALDLIGRNELPVIFPTFASLRTLADFDSLESVWREYREQGWARARTVRRK
jgi:8-oxo-dGTP pyrophosphatase MutT (NUDIX family)